MADKTMAFKVRHKTDTFKIPSLGGMSHVFFADYLGTTDAEANSPISGSWFRIEKGPEATPPRYEYDEIGVVIEGEIKLKDTTGQTAIVRHGDTFFIPRGSVITFSSDSYGLAWKCGGRTMSRL